MKRRKQGYDSRIDEAIGQRHRGAHAQSMKGRRDESKGMEKREGERSYAGDRGMDSKHRRRSKVKK